MIPYHAPGIRAHEITPDILAKVWFDEATPNWLGQLVGDAGYSEPQVDDFLDELSDYLADVQREERRLRVSIDRLRREVGQAPIDWAELDRQRGEELKRLSDKRKEERDARGH